MLKYLKALSVFAGTIIGVGIFGLPYVASKVGFFVVVLYFLLIVLAGAEVLVKGKNLYLSFLVMTAIFATHIWYGLLFPIGYFKKDLGVIPHKIDKKKKEYIGG